MRKAGDIPAYGLYGEDPAETMSVHCERISDRPGHHNWQIVPHRHQRLLQVIVLEQGAARAHVDGFECALAPEMFLFVPPETVHSFRFVPDTEGVVLSCPSTILAAYEQGQDRLRPYLGRAFCGDLPATLGGVVAQLAALEPAMPFYQHAATGLALFVLAAIAGQARDMRQTKAAAPRHAALDAYDRQIAEDLAAGIRRSPAEHAAALGLSLGHLSRLSHAATGRGAAAQLEARVMEEACRLLAFTNLGIAQAGYRLGYADPSYFTRRFTRTVGQTPTAYRSQCFQSNRP
jgi:AraC family transcriptional activator of pobA